MNRSVRWRLGVRGWDLSWAHPGLITQRRRVANRLPCITAFSIIRITRVRHRFAGGMCRKFCWAETMRRYGSGGGAAPWRRLGATGRSCSMGLGWARRIDGCWMRLCAARDLRRGEAGAVNTGDSFWARFAAGMYFAVAKIGANRLELEIVRCVLAPPERVCLEIMS